MISETIFWPSHRPQLCHPLPPTPSSTCSDLQIRYARCIDEEESRASPFRFDSTTIKFRSTCFRSDVCSGSVLILMKFWSTFRSLHVQFRSHETQIEVHIQQCSYSFSISVWFCFDSGLDLLCFILPRLSQFNLSDLLYTAPIPSNLLCVGYFTYDCFGFCDHLLSNLDLCSGFHFL